MNRVLQYTGLEQWLECPPIHDVTRTVEEFVDVELQSGVLKDADWPVLVELHQHINIAFRAFFASCQRTEHCGMRTSLSDDCGLLPVRKMHEDGPAAIRCRGYPGRRPTCREYSPPHFHARYGEFEDTIATGTSAVLRGQLPSRALGCSGNEAEAALLPFRPLQRRTGWARAFAGGRPHQCTGAAAGRQFFEQVFIDCGAVAWPGEIDLAPDAMYSQIVGKRPELQ
jgi:hypothetical protein